MADVDRSVHRVLVLLLIAGPAALLATAGGGWWLARRALRPIERLRAHAQEIGGDRLDERLAVPPAGDEVARLAATLNTMLARIQSGVEEQHRLVADASHELRSPLAAMRSELDVSLRADELTPAARRVLESTREEVDRMSRTVDDLLTLSSADDGRLVLLLEPVDLRQVAAATVPAMASRARSRGIEISIEGDAAFGAGDAERLRQALGNLVDNAIKYSPPGATVQVRTWSTAGEVGVSVEDDGPGIPIALHERVFDRFFRADVARGRGTGGSGIGLSIVRAVAKAHAGRAWVELRPGGGSTFSVAIPAVAVEEQSDARSAVPQPYPASTV
jgi:signal transduction histidine kinase